MSLEADVDLLRRVSLFSGLAADELRLLGFSSERVELAPGETLFQRGDPASSGFVVSRGSLILTGSGDPPSQETAGPGVLVGELPLFVETRRKATAVAAEPTTLIAISRQVMRRMLEEYPEVARQFHARFAGRLMGTIDDLKRVRDALLNSRS